MTEQERNLTQEQERNLQRERALRRANAIRSYRAKVKVDVAEARRDADEVLVCGDPRLDGLKIEELLRVVPGLGRRGVRLLLGRGLISPSMPISELTTRQRGFLLTALRSHRRRSLVYERKRGALRV